MPTTNSRLFDGILTVVATLMVMAGSNAANAQGAPVVRLGPPAAAVSEPFTDVTSAVELPNGRLLIADEKENRLVILDFAAGSAQQIGRRGAGPGEYLSLGELLPRAGGAWLTDFAQRRLLAIRDDGTFDNAVTFPGQILVRGADAAGHLYGEAFLPRTGPTRADSMWIIRWTPPAASLDTIMKYDAGVSMWTGGGGPTIKRRVYPPVDTWQPLPGGDILVLEAAEYRATFWREGKPQRSVRNVWEPVRFTPAERDAFIKARASKPVRMMGGGPPGGARDTPPAGLPAVEYEFPDAYPPFGGEGGGGRYTWLSPNGDVWVARARASSDSTPRYDVLNGATGVIRGTVTLAPRSRVVAIGSAGVYTVVHDADDIETLRRHPHPWP